MTEGTFQDRLPKVVSLEAKPSAFGDQKGPLNLVLADLGFENFNEMNLSLETVHYGQNRKRRHGLEKATKNVGV